MLNCYSSIIIVVAMMVASVSAQDEDERRTIKVSPDGDFVIHTAGSGKLFVDNQDLVADLNKCTADIGHGARFLTGIYTRGCHWFSRLLASSEHACD
jgi:hypothetical protein